MYESKAVLLEGTFTLEGLSYKERFESIDAERLLVEQEGKPTLRVVDYLRPALGQQVVFAMHHVPVVMNPFEWGGGNCKWQKEGWCPAGHHLDPWYFFNMTENGVLEESGGIWRIRDWLVHEKIAEIPFHKMVGHFGRIASATVLDAQKMADDLKKARMEDMQTLSIKADEAEMMLHKLLGREDD